MENKVTTQTGRILRDIKFRGKRIDSEEGEWVYGSLTLWADGDASILEPCANNEMANIRVLPDSVGQFTGLIDRNGKEIYEGDIISNGSSQTMTVMYDKSRAGFMGVTDYMTSYQTTRVWLLTMPDKELEVVGSIHDNRKMSKTKGRKRIFTKCSSLDDAIALAEFIVRDGGYEGVQNDSFRYCDSTIEYDFRENSRHNRNFVYIGVNEYRLVVGRSEKEMRKAHCEEYIEKERVFRQILKIRYEDWR